MKKRIIISSAILTLAIGTGVFVLDNSSNTPAPVQLVQNADSTTPVTSGSDTAQSQPLVISQDSAPNDPVPTQTVAPPSTTPTPAPPTTYYVTDQQAVMDGAGIAADQQPAANEVITRLMNWKYHDDNDAAVNLCYAVPIEKMAVMGADYVTNPITQLKWCNAIVIARYGTWDNALVYFNEHGTIY